MGDVLLDDPLANGKRERTKAANRQAILDAARRVFAELGYEAATVRDIIRGTQLASGTFYNYFKSKEEVFQALADDGARRFRPILRHIRETAESFDEYVVRALEAYFNFIVDEARERGIEAVMDQPQFVSASTSPERLAVHDEVRAGVRGLVKRGAAAHVDADYFATACIGIAESVGRMMLTRDHHDIEAATAFAATLITNGLRGLEALAPAA